MWLVLRSPLLDTERLKALSAFYALLLLVALTNMELLRLMPWRKGPTTYMTGCPTNASCCEYGSWSCAWKTFRS